jgi:hypothetical protein
VRGRGAAVVRLLSTLPLVVALTGAWPAAAQDPTTLLAPYLRARDARIVGEVAGQVAGDPPRPSGAPLPREGVSVMLLPYSADLQATLDAIKLHLRDSLKNYMGATAEVTQARAAYERELLGGGGGELIRGEVSDARGLFRLSEVPAGEWLLLGWRTETHPGKAPKLRKEDASTFRDIAVSTGYSTVSYWLMRLAVRGGEAAAVDLNDRNVWLTGIHDDAHVIEGIPKAAGSKKRR